MNSFFVRRNVCPGCGSPRFITLCTHAYAESPIRDYLTWYYAPVGPGVEFDYLEGSHYQLDECSDCGLIFQREVPGPQLMERLYGYWIDPSIVLNLERKERDASFFQWCATEIARGLQLLNNPPSEATFLDFGMGWGNWCLIAKGFGCKSYGMELSDVRSEHAARNGITVLNLSDLNSYKFDFINAEQVFEHIVNPLDTLKAFQAALNPEGVVRIGVPPGWDIKRRLAVGDWSLPDSAPDSLNAVAPLQHINCFNYHALVAMAEHAGLAPIEPPRKRCATSVRGAVKLILLETYRRLLPQRYNARMEARKVREGTVYLRKQGCTTNPAS